MKYICIVNMYRVRRSFITRYFRKYCSLQALVPKLVREERERERERASASMQCDRRIFAARDANQRSNRHFLGRAVCSVGETNNTQDSTPGLSEFGKVSQHLHCTPHCGFTFFSEQGNIAFAKKCRACTYTLPKEFPFYSRERSCATFRRKIIPQTSGQDASRHYSAKRSRDNWVRLQFRYEFHAL